mmetsp:Transcript_27942/g.74253  ORF Transcript_27942/g.74253 Transcript_27942/m.74253 type:complete len:370 (-) Transcript_27942:723-1832(-)
MALTGPARPPKLLLVLSTAGAGATAPTGRPCESPAPASTAGWGHRSGLVPSRATSAGRDPQQPPPNGPTSTNRPAAVSSAPAWGWAGPLPASPPAASGGHHAAWGAAARGGTHGCIGDAGVVQPLAVAEAEEPVPEATRALAPDLTTCSSCSKASTCACSAGGNGPAVPVRAGLLRAAAASARSMARRACKATTSPPPPALVASVAGGPGNRRSPSACERAHPAPLPLAWVACLWSPARASSARRLPTSARSRESSSSDCSLDGASTASTVGGAVAGVAAGSPTGSTGVGSTAVAAAWASACACAIVPDIWPRSDASCFLSWPTSWTPPEAASLLARRSWDVCRTSLLSSLSCCLTSAASADISALGAC